MPYGTPGCHRQFYVAPPCAMKEPPQKPDMNSSQVTKYSMLYRIEEDQMRNPK